MQSRWVGAAATRCSLLIGNNQKKAKKEKKALYGHPAIRHYVRAFSLGTRITCFKTKVNVCNMNSWLSLTLMLKRIAFKKKKKTDTMEKLGRSCKSEVLNSSWIST